MLDTRRASDLLDRLSAYVDDILGIPLKLQPAEGQDRLPAYLSRMYALYEGFIAGRICLFLLAGEQEGATPGDVRKHMDLILRARGDDLAIYVTPTLSAHNRKRLIGHLVPFIVPDNQLYIPDLAMDLREKLRRHRRRQRTSLSPAAQCLLISELLGFSRAEENQSDIAHRLNYSVMTIGRAFDDLAAAELASVRQDGRDRHLVFSDTGRDLFERASDFFTSPARAIRYVYGEPDEEWMVLSGEAALSRYTSLSHPKRYQYALTASAWRQLKGRWMELREEEAGPDAIEIASWSYDPRPLSRHAIVDPISLHIIYRGHDDPRVSEAADALLEMVEWH